MTTIPAGKTLVRRTASMAVRDAISRAKRFARRYTEVQQLRKAGYYVSEMDVSGYRGARLMIQGVVFFPGTGHWQHLSRKQSGDLHDYESLVSLIVKRVGKPRLVAGWVRGAE